MIQGYNLPLWGFAITLVGYITLDWTPLDEISALTQKPLPDNTQLSQETNIYAGAGFEPATPASKLQHTHVLDGAVIAISPFSNTVIISVTEM